MTTATTLNKISQIFGYGQPNASMYELFHGFSRYGTADLVPPNLDYQGYAFFTKPRFNLLDENISPINKLQYLTQGGANSTGATIRSYLMPKQDQDLYKGTNVRSNAVDDAQAFIPFLSNTLVSLSGWGDETTETLATKPGRARQVRSYPDSRPELFGTYDLTATFIAKDGDPHEAFFTAYREYITNKLVGKLVPFPDTIAYGETDHDMAIYMLMLGNDKETIHKIARTGGGSMPIVGATGASFNWDRTKTVNDSRNTISVPFHSDGIIYNDPMLIRDFNHVVRIFNRDMDDSRRSSKMVKLGSKESIYLNNLGYPRIDESSMKLEWWLDIATYNNVMNDLADVLESNTVGATS